MKDKVSLIICFLSLIFILSLFGCKNNKENEKEPIIEPKISGNSVVIYFSATGTTEGIAKRISKQSNSDIIKIIPKEKYTSEDLNYNSDCRANREQNDINSRPEIENEIDISTYDIVFLGYPIWWGTNPKIILTLLDTYDFTGKTIIPFCTSGSSSIDNSVNELRNYNKQLTIKDGKRFSDNSSDLEIKEFIDENIEINNDSNEEINIMKITIDGKEYAINLENNDTVKSLVSKLPQEFKMNELNGNEKYVNLDYTLPTDSYNPGRINAGDVTLYGNDCLVIFYKSFDTQFSYTKIGHIDNLPDLGNGSVNVKIEK